MAPQAGQMQLDTVVLAEGAPSRFRFLALAPLPPGSGQLSCLAV